MARPKKVVDKSVKQKRNKVVKPKKREAVPAIYSRQGNVICGMCLSRPSVRLRVDYDIAGKYGYSMLQYPQPYCMPDGEMLEVKATKYPCSNPDCGYDILVFNESGKPGREGHLKIMESARMREETQQRYDAGTTDKRGVWRTSVPAP